MDDQLQLPDYLYHYTSIDCLALILKNRTIRLNPLDEMDDLQEQMTADLKNAGRFTFVSSWTEESKELIPMWKMYTNPSCGVRIKLRKLPFRKIPTDSKKYADECSKILLNPSPIKPDSGLVDTFLDGTDMLKKKMFYSSWHDNSDLLKKVNYTDNPDLLEPQIIIKNDKHGYPDKLRMGLLGINKNTFWSFQKEWRYCMTIQTLPLDEKGHLTIESIDRRIKRITQGEEPKAVPYFDLSIALDAFENMEIVPSPQMTPGYRIILNNLVERYNPSAKILESALINLV